MANIFISTLGEPEPKRPPISFGQFMRERQIKAPRRLSQSNIFISRLKTIIRGKKKPLKYGPLGFGEVVKQLPSATLEAFPKVGIGIKNLFIEALRATPRTAASLALERGEQKQLVPETRAEKFLFGKAPIKPLSTQFEEAKRALGPEFGIVQIPIAGAAVFGGALLDLTLFGGGKKQLVDSLVKEGTEIGIKKLLTKAKVPVNLIDDFAPQLVKAKTTKEVSNLLKTIEKPIKGLPESIFPTKKIGQEVLEASEKVGNIEVQIQNLEETLKANPARELEKYANRKTGELPEVLGIGEGFRKRGDDIAETLGYPDSETARRAYEKYVVNRESLKDLVDQKKFLKSIEKGTLKRERGIKNNIKKIINKIQQENNLSDNVLVRLKEKHKIKEWKNATSEQLSFVLDDIQNLSKGDQMISKTQVESLKEFGIKNWTTKREATEIIGDVTGWKDRSAKFFNFFKTIDQKIEAVAGKESEKLKNILIRPREKAVGNMFKEEITLKNEMRAMLDDLRLKGKKDRALIMRYGEGRIKLDELKKAIPDKWENIVRADNWFRKQYDNLLETTNKELSRFYKDDKLIPKRKDYYTHAQEMGSVWNQLRNKGGDINPVLEQISEFTRPNRKFNPFALRRKGGAEFIEDAGRAFEAYLNPILHNKHMTESIVRHRAVADILAHNTLKTKNVNQFIFSLRDAADSLAGKTNPFDRALMNRVLGRKPIQLISQASTRLAKNRIIGNVGSAVMQISGVPNSVMKNNIIRTSKGLLTQAVSPFLGKNDPLLKSKFLLRRYGEKGLHHGESVFPTIIKRGEKIASIPFEVIEKNITKGLWRASFNNAYSQGYRGLELIQKTDEITASIVGARSIGEKALAFESGVLSLPLQFQLEVNTHAQLWADEVFKKIFKNPVKATRAATETAITLFLFNTLFNKTMGRTPLPDPIRAAGEAMEADTWSEGIGRIGGEALSSVAGGQFFANLVPHDIRKKYFGRSEVGIYPGGIPITSALEGVFRTPTNFVFDFVLPYGGGQLKKIFQGIEGVDKMGSFNKSDKLQFPINQNQWLQVILFGKYSTKEAQEYFDKQRTPLTEKQTVEYFLRTQEGENPQNVYKDIAKDRIRKEYEREIVDKLIKRIKAKPDEGLALLQLWVKEKIVSEKMEEEILKKLSK